MNTPDKKVTAGQTNLMLDLTDVIAAHLVLKSTDLAQAIEVVNMVLVALERAQALNQPTKPSALFNPQFN